MFDISECSAKWKGLAVGPAGEIVAADFLDATDSIIAILDALGSGLAMVKSDMTGNAGHIRKHVAAAPPGVTLQALVQKDIQAGVAGKDGTAAMSLLWLKRYAARPSPTRARDRGGGTRG